MRAAEASVSLRSEPKLLQCRQGAEAGRGVALVAPLRLPGDHRRQREGDSIEDNPQSVSSRRVVRPVDDAVHGLEAELADAESQPPSCGPPQAHHTGIIREPPYS